MTHCSICILDCILFWNYILLKFLNIITFAFRTLYLSCEPQQTQWSNFRGVFAEQCQSSEGIFLSELLDVDHHVTDARAAFHPGNVARKCNVTTVTTLKVSVCYCVTTWRLTANGKAPRSTVPLYPVRYWLEAPSRRSWLASRRTWPAPRLSEARDANADWSASDWLTDWDSAGCGEFALFFSLQKAQLRQQFLACWAVHTAAQCTNFEALLRTFRKKFVWVCSDGQWD